MNIIKVIPLSKSVRKENLSYFSIKQIELGSIVAVPVRKKLVDALVVEVLDMSSSKLELKKADFQLKRIDSVKGESFLSEEFTQACLECANYFATNLGTIISSFVPKILFQNYEKLPKKDRLEKREKERVIKEEKLILQSTLEDRISFYKILIRESLARRQSVFLCLPTISDVELFASLLEKGIEDRVFKFHSALTNKKILESYASVVEKESPVLVVATPPYLSMPQKDIGTVILEKESSSAYRTIGQQSLDMRILAEVFASKSGARFIIADSSVRVETLYRREIGLLEEAAPLTWRIDGARFEKVDMRSDTAKEVDGTKQLKTTSKNKPESKFRVFSEEAEKIAKKELVAGKNVFFFALRKGLAGSVVCADCGESAMCPRCGYQFSLYQKDEGQKPVLLCNHCRKIEDSQTLCRNCGSWNLKELGIGTDLVFREAKRIFPDRQIFRIDSERATGLTAEKIIQEVEKEKGSILIGTEMALHKLKRKVALSVVVSMDSLFTIPNFRINEKAKQILLMLSEKSEERVLIQTRNPEALVILCAERRNFNDFYVQEIDSRKKFMYPPFSVVIKIGYEGKVGTSIRERNKMLQLFKDYKPSFFNKSDKNQEALYALMKIDKSKWSIPGLSGKDTQDQNLLEKLKSLPPGFFVNIDPEEIF